MVIDGAKYTIDEAKEIRSRLLEGLPKAGIVEIKLKNPKKTAGLVIRSIANRPFITEDGIEKKHVLDSNLKLNMDNVEDRLLYGQLINHTIFNKKYKVFDVVDKETEAENVISFKSLSREAEDIVLKMSDNDARDFARVIGIQIGIGNSISVLKKDMFDRIDVDPESFLNAWKDADKTYKILLKLCYDNDIAKKENGRILINGQSVGTTEGEALEYFKANKDLLPSIRKQLKK